MLESLAIDPRRAGHEPLGVGLEFADPRTGDQSGARGDGLRPMGDVGRCLRAFRTALLARAALDARTLSVVRRREDRVELGPPVPAEPRVGARNLGSTRTDRQRRQRWILAAGW